MGSTAGITTRTGEISFKNNPEFASAIRTILHQSGMMEITNVQMYDKRIALLKPPDYKDGVLTVCYNYYENNWWERAGVNLEKGYFWSDKIGYNQYATAVMAAYLYESQIYDDISAVDCSGRNYILNRYIGWLNHILHTEFYCKGYDPWPTFELYHIHYPEKCKNYNWDLYFDQSVISTIGYFEIQSVLHGTEEAAISLLKKFDENPRDDRYNLMPFFEELQTFVLNYKKQATISEEEQINQLLQAIRHELATQEWKLSSIKKDSILYNIIQNLCITDAPVFLVKYISEVYRKDFWELWETITNVSKRRLFIFSVAPVSTEDFFDVTADDRIFWWTEDEPLVFSQELKNWFSFLSERYHEILSSGSPAISLRELMDLLELSSKKFYLLLAFEPFFEETIDNMNDKRYAALWSLYKLLLLDPSFQDQCFTLFGQTDSRDQILFKLLRRFHALAANKPLRSTVFGF